VEDPAYDMTDFYSVFNYADSDTLSEVTIATQEIVDPASTRLTEADVSAGSVAYASLLDTRC
jgi:hypothetical protein